MTAFSITDADAITGWLNAHRDIWTHKTVNSIAIFKGYPAIGQPARIELVGGPDMHLPEGITWDEMAHVDDTSTIRYARCFLRDLTIIWTSVTYHEPEQVAS